MVGSTKHKSWRRDTSFNDAFQAGVDPRTRGMRSDAMFAKMALEHSKFVFNKLQKAVNGEWRRIVKSSTIGRWPPAANADILPHVGDDGVRKVGKMYVFSVGWYPYKHRSGNRDVAIQQSEERLAPRLATLFQVIRKIAERI